MSSVQVQYASWYTKWILIHFYVIEQTICTSITHDSTLKMEITLSQPAS